MKNYRLKKEAVQFFHKKYATAIYPIHFWDNIHVDPAALEEVEPCYLAFGHKNNESSTSLSGWSKDASHFHFTIYFPSMKHREYDVHTDGRMMRELMDQIQYIANRHFENLFNPEKSH